MRLNLPVARLGAAHLFHVRKRRCPIDVRLAPAQSIEVRPRRFIRNGWSVTSSAT
jgi:hypothetical protein